MHPRHPRTLLRRTFALVALLLAAAATGGVATAGATPSSSLTRYPYLTDSIQTSITVNWATTTAGTTGSVRYGRPGACTASTKSASKTTITVNGKTEYQWKATIPVSPDTAYCYRPMLGSTDLLGSDASPPFTSQAKAGSTAPFTFAVFGDWGYDDVGTGNVHQANVLQQLSRSGARFAVMTGDTAYQQGSQTNYGDLQQTGVYVSDVFGPSYWAVPGRSLPVFFTMGNHGFTSGNTAKVNWPETNAASTSGGKYTTESYPSVNGSTAATYPSMWYAFDAGNARFYVLTASWADNNLGTGDVYANDWAAHWQTSSAQYQWLQNDLATHPRALKFAFWHYPIYSDSRSARSDTHLQGGPGTLQGLLNANHVNMVFNGHGHGYERNQPDAAGMVPYMFGNGGADLGPVGSPCSAFDLYAIAASGTSCGSAPGGLSDDHVYGFAKVTVNGQQVTVTPTDELGRTFDVQSYTFPDGSGTGTGGGGTGSTVTLTPTDDASVDQTNATTNYGSGTKLTTDGSPVIDFLMRFDVPSSCTAVSSAKLSLTVGGTTNNDSAKGGDVYATDPSWSEGTVNWGTAPAKSASAVASLGPVALNTAYTVDVSPAVTGPGPVSLRVSTTSGDAAAYLSKEGSASAGPRLAVTC